MRLPNCLVLLAFLSCFAHIQSRERSNLSPLIPPPGPALPPPPRPVIEPRPPSGPRPLPPCPVIGTRRLPGPGRAPPCQVVEPRPPLVPPGLSRVNITCDNKLWFYAGYQPIVDGSTPGQGNWRVTKHVGAPPGTKVYGIKCEDFHVVAGIIASFEDGTVTDGTWKCTSVTPGANWLSENYDDSSWQPAHVIHTNNNPSYYWGIRPDISSVAQWIWTDGWRGQDRTVYCRKVVQDRIDVNITCDNKLWFYADDQTIVDESTTVQGNWRKTKHVKVPADTKVYGVKCKDFHVVAGIIASFSDGSTTDHTWKCTSVTPGANWLSENYDDSSWQPAHVIHTNNKPSYYWGIRPDISSVAQWIWTDGWRGQDRTVYCRKVVQDRIDVNITCDNKLWFYADDQTIVDESTTVQGNWRKTKHVKVPADTKVYGVKCKDFHVVAGIIASFSDGSTTDHTWKCTSVTPGANWLSENYDDSSWQPAHVIHTNNKPSYYWGIRPDISSVAQWIWTDGWKGKDRTVYCRKVVQDIISVKITCDNKLWFYADGETIIDENTPGQDNWRTIKQVTVPADTKVYGIKCRDFHVVAGIIASFSDGDITDSSWRCTNTDPGAGWLTEIYDDSNWTPAYTIHTNNAPSYYWGLMSGVSSNAKWIWTRGWHGMDKTVYCRKVKGAFSTRPFVLPGIGLPRGTGNVRTPRGDRIKPVLEPVRPRFESTQPT